MSLYTSTVSMSYLYTDVHMPWHLAQLWNLLAVGGTITGMAQNSNPQGRLDAGSPFQTSYDLETPKDLRMDDGSTFTYIYYILSTLMLRIIFIIDDFVCHFQVRSCCWHLKTSAETFQVESFKDMMDLLTNAACAVWQSKMLSQKSPQGKASKTNRSPRMCPVTRPVIDSVACSWQSCCLRHGDLGGNPKTQWRFVRKMGKITRKKRGDITIELPPASPIEKWPAGSSGRAEKPAARRGLFESPVLRWIGCSPRFSQIRDMDEQWTHLPNILKIL